MADTVLVTGGAGFIGSHVVDAFLDEGFEVAIVDNLQTGARINVNPKARFYQADIRDGDALERIFAREKPTVVAHQAALADVRHSLQYPDWYAEVNIVGTIRLLEAARRHGVRKVTFASTGGAIYGDADCIPTTEDADAHPLDPYGVSKLACEHYLFSYHHNYGLNYCALRYGNVYGPRQNSRGEAGVVAIFTSRMLAGEQAVIYGDGLQTRDFVFVGDVARANVMAAMNGCGLYNIGTSVSTNINTVFRELARITDYALPEAHAGAKPGEVQVSCLDPSKAKSELRWEPRVLLADGLAKTVTFFAPLHGER